MTPFSAQHVLATKCGIPAFLHSAPRLPGTAHKKVCFTTGRLLISQPFAVRYLQQPGIIPWFASQRAASLLQPLPTRFRNSGLCRSVRQLRRYAGLVLCDCSHVNRLQLAWFAYVQSLPTLILLPNLAGDVLFGRLCNILKCSLMPYTVIVTKAGQHRSM